MLTKFKTEVLLGKISCTAASITLVTVHSASAQLVQPQGIRTRSVPVRANTSSDLNVGRVVSDLAQAKDQHNSASRNSLGTVDHAALILGAGETSRLIPSVLVSLRSEALAHFSLQKSLLCVTFR